MTQKRYNESNFNIRYRIVYTLNSRARTAPERNNMVYVGSYVSQGNHNKIILTSRLFGFLHYIGSCLRYWNLANNCHYKL